MKRDREASLTLEILEAIDTQSDVTQRHLADQLGVALGLANSYLRRCVRKGLVKIQQAPANRYLYYLTPQGFAEKGRLTAEYLSTSFEFYRRASADIADALSVCKAIKAQRVMFAGVSEFAEIGALRSMESELEIIGTFDPASERLEFAGRHVWSSLEDMPPIDAFLYTALDPAPGFYAELVGYLDAEHVVVPQIVKPLVANSTVSP